MVSPPSRKNYLSRQPLSSPKPAAQRPRKRAGTMCNWSTPWGSRWTPTDTAGRSTPARRAAGRIKSVRKKFAQDVGFLPPVVHIRDNLELGPNTYLVSLKDAEIGRAEVFPGKWLAIDPGQVTGKLEGTATQDPPLACPPFGLAAISASMPRCMATRWWMPAPWLRPI